MGQMRVRRTGPWVKISCPFSWVQFNSACGSRCGSVLDPHFDPHLFQRFRNKKHRKPKFSMLFGAGGVTRTHDLLITNQLLYRLSYTSAFVQMQKEKNGLGAHCAKASSMMLHNALDRAVKEKLILTIPRRIASSPGNLEKRDENLHPDHISSYLNAAGNALPMFYLELVSGLRKE